MFEWSSPGFSGPSLDQHGVYIKYNLEIAGLIEKAKQGGRSVTSKGQSILDNTAFDVKKVLQKEMSLLSKY